MKNKGKKIANEEKIDPLVEMKGLLQRKQAELENYRKLTDKRVSEIHQMASKDVILQILPVMDNFELALKNVHGKKDDFVKGVELIHVQLLDILKKQGVKIINTEKEKFDPYLHEALMKVPSELPENKIIEEFQKGYMLNDKVIRHAKVKISAGKKQE